MQNTWYHSFKFQGLEESGERFPYQIPPKNAKKDFENRSLSPVDWTEMWTPVTCQALKIFLQNFPKILFAGYVSQT